MRIMMFALAALVFSASAAAEIKRIDLGYSGKATINSTYRNGNEIRVYITGPSSTMPQELARVAIREIAEMSRAKAHPRFAVTKISDCGTMRMNNIPLYSSCRLLGRMLGEGESARSEGKREIAYFRTDDVLAGRIVAESQLKIP